MAKKRKEYTESDWKGITKYNCGYCFFDSFDENEIQKHIADNHREKEEPKKHAIPLKDRFGNFIVDQHGEKIYKYV